MTADVPPLSKVPGYQPVAAPDDPSTLAGAFVPAQVMSGPRVWSGPRTVTVSALVAAVVALLVTILLH